jgi:hypothetical protein
MFFVDIKLHLNKIINIALPMKIPIENNKFCTVLIVLINLSFIAIVFSMSILLGRATTKVLFLSMYPVTLIGNVIVWRVMRSGSPGLAKNYRFVIFGLAILFVPLAMLF